VNPELSIQHAPRMWIQSYPQTTHPDCEHRSIHKSRTQTLNPELSIQHAPRMWTQSLRHFKCQYLLAMKQLTSYSSHFITYKYEWTAKQMLPLPWKAISLPTSRTELLDIRLITSHFWLEQNRVRRVVRCASLAASRPGRHSPRGKNLFKNERFK
jgi:hypothetical protein